MAFFSNIMLSNERAPAENASKLLIFENGLIDDEATTIRSAKLWLNIILQLSTSLVNQPNRHEVVKRNTDSKSTCIFEICRFLRHRRAAMKIFFHRAF